MGGGGGSDPHAGRRPGGIDLETLQKVVHFPYSVALDLYGLEISFHSANYYTSGLKGRFGETRLGDDHSLASDQYPVAEVNGGKIAVRMVPALTALNARLRDDYVKELQAGLDRWNRVPERFGNPFHFTL